MKRAALTLAAFAVVCLAANQAFAERRSNRVTHKVAGHETRSSGFVTVSHYGRPGYYGSGHYGRRGSGPRCGYAHGAVPLYVPRYPVAVPYYGYYRPYTYPYYRPYYGFGYSGPGFSLGIGF